MLDLQLESQNPNTPSIDLHEFKNSHEALEFLETEIYGLYKNSEQYVRVIHGIGKGILKAKVHESLKANPLIKSFEMEENGGVTIFTFYPHTHP
ncbi:Smr/MutS family protein [Candidatus Parcubacteria bacterium]|jgi:dsDNA-specific endonuclease/ATPase MutS2|nr:Smr/MutS family protein [Candidatus Parcubacteria bacterium]MBT3948538.1 Smr/MutS family protein [Candidatus Parcubacteria bacterium]